MLYSRKFLLLLSSFSFCFGSSALLDADTPLPLSMKRPKTSVSFHKDVDSFPEGTLGPRDRSASNLLRKSSVCLQKLEKEATALVASLSSSGNSDSGDEQLSPTLSRKKSAVGMCRQEHGDAPNGVSILDGSVAEEALDPDNIEETVQYLLSFIHGCLAKTKTASADQEEAEKRLKEM